MNAKRILALLFAVLMVAGCLTACTGNGGTPTGTEPAGTQAATGGSTELTFVPWSAEDIADMGARIKEEANGGTVKLKIWQPDTAQEVFRAQADKFIEIFKDYATIEIEMGVQGENDVAGNVISDKDAAADVYGFASDQAERLIKGNAVTEVFFANEVASMNTADSVEAAKNAEGKLIAYPEVGSNSYFLCYDKRDITEEQAKTLEGIFEACKAKNKNFIMDAGNGYFSCMFLFTGGLATDGFEEDGETQKFNDYDIDKVTASAMAFANLFKTYKANFEANGTGNVISGFRNGTTSAGLIGSWDIAAAKTALGENAGFAILPTINIDGTDTQIYNMFGYKYIGVNPNSKFPYAAQALAYYLTNEECQLERAEKLEWAPSNINASNNDIVKNNGALNASLAQAAYSVPQVNIAQVFWDPCAAFGKYIIESGNDFSADAVKAEVEKCINNIRDM
ncbi:MAG: extracellular solute-binding protein [Ruminococcus sp.]|nr:extracellular solute-binding protein [Ruminococcus sp.]